MSANAIERIRANAQHILEGPGAVIPSRELVHIPECPGCLIDQDVAAVEALLEAVDETLGYGADLNPVWQLGAGQDWTEWTEAKDRLRAARRRVESGQ